MAKKPAGAAERGKQDKPAKPNKAKKPKAAAKAPQAAGKQRQRPPAEPRQPNPTADLVTELLESPLVAETLAAGAAAALGMFVQHGLNRREGASAKQALKNAGKAAAAAMGAKLSEEFDKIMDAAKKAKPEAK